MKICLIADGTVHTQRWATYFVQQGDEVHLITYEQPKIAFEGVKLHVLTSFFHNIYVSFIPRHIKIYFLVKQLKPDVIHAHFISKFGFHAAFLGMSPVLMSAWGDDILIIPYWSKLLWFLTKVSLKQADRIYAVSDDIANKIIRDFKINREYVKVVPFGVDTELFRPEARKENGKRVIVFSNRSFYKVYNIETFIRAIPIVLEYNKNIFFVIKGSGPFENSLKKLVDELSLAEYVRFIGWTKYEEMPKYLNECDIYVSTALSDGTPVSVLEAMASGTACIVTNVGGVSEWIKDNVNGLLIPPQRPDILAQKILELAKDTEKRKIFGKEARQTIIQKGKWENIMKGVRKDYEEFAKKYEL